MAIRRIPGYDSCSEYFGRYGARMIDTVIIFLVICVMVESRGVIVVSRLWQNQTVMR